MTDVSGFLLPSSTPLRARRVSPGHWADAGSGPTLGGLPVPVLGGAACCVDAWVGGAPVHAGRHAPLAVENPCQGSACRYPSSYRPRAPTFSRAAWGAQSLAAWSAVYVQADICRADLLVEVEGHITCKGHLLP